MSSDMLHRFFFSALCLIAVASGYGETGETSDFSQALGKIEEQIPLSTSRAERYRLLKQQGELALLAGDLETAQTAYQNASFVYPQGDATDFASLLKSAELLFELGELRVAKTQAQVVAQQEKETKLGTAAELLLDRIALFDSSASGKVELSSSGGETPVALYWDIICASLSGDGNEAARLKGLLLDTWSASPEAMIISGQARKFESFSDLILASYLSPSSSGDEGENRKQEASVARAPKEGSLFLQAGSFTDRENAEYLVIDLQKAGFSASIVEADVQGTHYYRVVLSSEKDDAEQFLLELKEAGFEASAVY
ncbi:SPOR domain-containing protein [Sediminispirochaeta smaragdinae]|uniref:Sporulation domain protein n=1 Tax=Sediminispirochaeta smaragdinae (strain DSM 11293 / JCM 15392 / SEBR 4228) TaxID=573413 RepID=E1R3A7_SEDSS|nr:SPOR domain-containing protein [Sediminispirochaeta smaragdinae]ADK81538.1 Sporulation domain protein [Sediminispirochaeta smaragdinae DSM 11293]